MPVTSSLLESTVLDSLRAFLLTVLQPSTEVIKAQGNRVAQPAGNSFVFMTPRGRRRLAYTETDYQDCTFTGSISAGQASFTASIQPSQQNPGLAEMLVTAVADGSGPIVPGGVVVGSDVLPGTRVVAQLALDTGGVGIYFLDKPQTVASEPMSEGYGILDVTTLLSGEIGIGASLVGAVWPPNIAPNTYVTAFGTGTGAVGTYYLSIAQQVSSGEIAAGSRIDLAEAEYTVQLDVYGPTSFDDTTAIDTLFRDWPGVLAIGQGTAFEAAPLYCGDAHQMPLVDGEQQYEYRWTMDACLQVNPSISSPQQFFDKLVATAQIVPIPPAPPTSVYLVDGAENFITTGAGNRILITGAAQPGDVTIDELPTASGLTGSEWVPVWQADVTAKTTTDDIANLAPPAPPPPVVSVTAATYSISPSQSGTLFDNYGATAPVAFDLPMWQSGLSFTFTLAADQQITVIANGSDQIAIGSATSGQVSASTPYSSIIVGTTNQPGVWIVRSFMGGWS